MRKSYGCCMPPPPLFLHEKLIDDCNNSGDDDANKKLLPPPLSHSTTITLPASSTSLITTTTPTMTPSHSIQRRHHHHYRSRICKNKDDYNYGQRNNNSYVTILKKSLPFPYLCNMSAALLVSTFLLTTTFTFSEAIPTTKVHRHHDHASGIPSVEGEFIDLGGGAGVQGDEDTEYPYSPSHVSSSSRRTEGEFEGAEKDAKYFLTPDDIQEVIHQDAVTNPNKKITSAADDIKDPTYVDGGGAGYYDNGASDYQDRQGYDSYNNYSNGTSSSDQDFYSKYLSNK